MTFECFSIDYDHRLQTFLAVCRTTYDWYLTATQGAEGNLAIQRDIVKGQKTYATLREDLKRGCVLPPIVLAVSHLHTPDSISRKPETGYFVADPDTLASVTFTIENSVADAIQIIDGLQRTNAIRSVRDELEGKDRDEFLARPIRIEVWLNIRLDALAYRMLLLNAGQKPMSMKHQIEILADSMRASLNEIANLDIIRGIDKRRRVQPGQFQLSILTGAFQAWLQRSPNIDLRNAITEQLLSEDAIDELGQGLSPNTHPTGDRFKELVSWLVELDQKLGAENIQFLGNETVVHAISAAVSKLSSTPGLEKRCSEAQARLIQEIEIRGPQEGFGTDLFLRFRQEIDPKKQNVGDAIRNFVFRAFQEYIIADGTMTMPEAWTFASQYLK